MKATTEQFAELVIEMAPEGTPIPPTAVIPTSVSNAATAVVTIDSKEIDRFANGDSVTISGISDPAWGSLLNGAHVIAAVNAAGTFELTGVDTSAQTGPYTGPMQVRPPAERPDPASATASKAASAVFTVDSATIALINTGDTVTFAGAPASAPWAALNGDKVVGVITGNTFVLVPAFDSSTAAAGLTTGLTVQPALQPDTPIVWERICGLTTKGISRQHNTNSVPVPDCDDESLPPTMEKSVESSEVTVSGNGVWAAQSHPTMMSWWRSAKNRLIRVGNLKAPAGSVMYELGPALLTQLNHTVDTGQKVQAEIAIEFDGMPDIQLAA